MDIQGEGFDLPSELVETEFDPRLADVWFCMIRAGIEPGALGGMLAPFLRMAYLIGYQDALSEEERGSLFISLGLRPPRRVPSNRTGRSRR